MLGNSDRSKVTGLCPALLGPQWFSRTRGKLEYAGNNMAEHKTIVSKNDPA